MSSIMDNEGMVALQKIIDITNDIQYCSKIPNIDKELITIKREISRLLIIESLFNDSVERNKKYVKLLQEKEVFK